MIEKNANNDEEVKIEALDTSNEVIKGADEYDKEDSQAEDVPLEKMTKSQLIERIGELNKNSEKNYDLYIRSQADLDNMKKRFQKEKEGLIKFSNDSLIKQLLPVVDSLEKALAHSEEDVSADAIREGIELTRKELANTLKNAGVEEIEALGKPFDPNLHDAMYEQEDDSVEPGIVLEELQKGYLLHKRLLRPSMVAVSKDKD
ncbi:nucleotide exchange factor GrpE [Thermodesulfobacteriota bacterium]